MTNVSIVGSRKRISQKDREQVKKLILSLNKDDIVVSGGARGIDSFAEQEAEKVGLDVVSFRPIINSKMSYSEMCDEYHRRNRQIVDEVNIVYAFPNKILSGGTKYTVEYAKKIGKKVVIIE